MTVQHIRCSDVQVGDVLVEIFGVDRRVVRLKEWQHPTCSDLKGRIAEYEPGPTKAITLIEGGWIDVRRPD